MTVTATTVEAPVRNRRFSQEPVGYLYRTTRATSSLRENGRGVSLSLAGPCQGVLRTSTGPYTLL
jgi:hypothetical protein